jgi:serine/threonine-protein kinase
VGEHRGQHFFTMEYVEGQSLGQLLKRGPRPIEEIARLVKTIAMAVHYLHRQGLVHRDLKPSNILVDEHGRPYVTDFGLAKVLEGDGNVSSAGAILGTPHYMSPEQAAGRAAQVGPRSDIYSLGAILYEMLTGRPPHDGESPLDTLVQVIEGECTAPRKLNAKIPRQLELICLKCLEKRPDDRYQTAADLAADLDHHLRGEQVEAGRTDFWHLLRGWARREPSLVARLGSMAASVVIILANALLIGVMDRNAKRAIAVVAIWAGASVLFQGLLRRTRWEEASRYGWAIADVLMFTVLVAAIGGLNTSLVAGFFLVVTASGLWFREKLVWLTTLLSMIGYASLAIVGGNDPRAGDSPYHHVILATALAVCGLTVSYQIRRVRALSQYYESRPLP